MDCDLNGVKLNLFISSGKFLLQCISFNTPIYNIYKQPRINGDLHTIRHIIHLSSTALSLKNIQIWKLTYTFIMTFFLAKPLMGSWQKRNVLNKTSAPKIEMRERNQDEGLNPPCYYQTGCRLIVKVNASVVTLHSPGSVWNNYVCQTAVSTQHHFKELENSMEGLVEMFEVRRWRLFFFSAIQHF